MLLFPSLVLIALKIASISPVEACDITQSVTRFPNGFGTHTSYYCRATEAEKQLATQAAFTDPCLNKKLTDLNLEQFPIPEIRELKPYWFTRKDAELRGPVLELRFLVHKDPEANVETEYRMLANGQKLYVLPPTPNLKPIVTIYYDLEAPERIERQCWITGCKETIFNLCQQVAETQSQR